MNSRLKTWSSSVESFNLITLDYSGVIMSQAKLNMTRSKYGIQLLRYFASFLLMDNVGSNWMLIMFMSWMFTWLMILLSRHTQPFARSTRMTVTFSASINSSLRTNLSKGFTYLSLCLWCILLSMATGSRRITWHLSCSMVIMMVLSALWMFVILWKIFLKNVRWLDLARIRPSIAHVHYSKKLRKWMRLFYMKTFTKIKRKERKCLIFLLSYRVK